MKPLLGHFCRCPWSRGFLLLLPTLLTIILNLNVLQNGFVWDDITIHQRAEDASGIKAAQSGQYYYRPVVFASYRLDRWIWGIDPRGYHLTGLILHSLNTSLVTLIGILLLRKHPQKMAIVLTSSAIFAVHPIHTEVVAWIAGRNDLLATFFLLVAFTLHLLLRDGSPPRYLLPLFSMAVALSLLSKETALPYLFLFVLFDGLFFRVSQPVWKRLSTPTTGVILILAILYFWFRTRTLPAAVPSPEVSGESLLQPIAQMVLAVGWAIQKLIFPVSLNAYILPPSHFGFPDYFLMGLGIALVIGIATVSIQGHYRIEMIYLWGIILGLAASLYLPFVRVTDAFVAERYLYLPSVTFSYLAGTFLVYAVRTWIPPAVKPASLVFLGAVLIGAGILSFRQNQVWRSELSLWEDTVKKSPDATLAYNRLGRAYQARGERTKAREAFQLALQGIGRPEVLANAATSLGAGYIEEGRFDLAYEAYQKALEYHEARTEPHFGLGLIYWNRYHSGPMKGDRSLLSSARYHLMASVLYSPDYAQGYHLLGRVHLEANLIAKAQENFQKVIQLNPESELARDARRQLSRLAGRKDTQP